MNSRIRLTSAKIGVVVEVEAELGKIKKSLFHTILGVDVGLGGW